MSVTEYLRLLELIVWPAVAVSVLLVLRPSITALLSGAKVKLSIAGQSIETTLPELKLLFEEQATEPLNALHNEYLRELLTSGPKAYPDGVHDSETREFLRPLRNAGLVHTQPRGARLKKASAIDLSGLGRLYLRALGERIDHA